MIPNKLYNRISLRGWSMLITATLLFSGCESKVLDLNPVNKLTSEDAYTTADRCDLAVLGVYDAAQQGKYDGDYTRGYPFGSASIIQGEMRGEDMVSTAAFYNITYTSIYTATSLNNLTMWEASFEAVGRCNTVLHGLAEAVENGVITQSVYDGYKGELLFLRALTYHNLMVHFALPYNIKGENKDYGLPIYKDAITSVDDIDAALEIGRSSVEETYKFILQDLDDAENLMNSNHGNTRATTGAAVALKTRVYLHMRDWENVKREAVKLNGVYKVESDPETPFVNQEGNSESIFSIANSSTDNPGANGAIGYMLHLSGRGLLISSPILYNSTFWLEDDKRRDILMYQDDSTDDEGKIIYGNHCYYTAKYPDYTTRADNAPLLRYAEVLLNYAEAAIRSTTPDKALAVALLNEVRDRSLADPATQSYNVSDFSTNEAVLEAILWERRIEFHGEGRRWEDIHRLAKDDVFPSGGIPAKIDYTSIQNTQKTPQDAFGFGKAIESSWYNNVGFIDYTDYRFLWPIPDNDLATNPLLKSQQNQGW